MTDDFVRFPEEERIQGLLYQREHRHVDDSIKIPDVMDELQIPYDHARWNEMFELGRGNYHSYFNKWWGNYATKHGLGSDGGEQDQFLISHGFSSNNQIVLTRILTYLRQDRIIHAPEDYIPNAFTSLVEYQDIDPQRVNNWSDSVFKGSYFDSIAITPRGLAFVLWAKSRTTTNPKGKSNPSEGSFNRWNDCLNYFALRFCPMELVEFVLKKFSKDISTATTSFYWSDDFTFAKYSFDSAKYDTLTSNIYSEAAQKRLRERTVASKPKVSKLTAKNIVVLKRKGRILDYLISIHPEMRSPWIINDEVNTSVSPQTVRGNLTDMMNDGWLRRTIKKTWDLPEDAKGNWSDRTDFYHEYGVTDLSLEKGFSNPYFAKISEVSP